MSLLSVTVKRAKFIGPQANQLSTYVTLKLQHVKSTTVTVKGAEPCWEQDFLFETEQMDTGLLVEVWSKGLLWDKALGYTWLPLVDVQYSNEEGLGQWFPLDAELVMNNGEVVGTRGPTGDQALLDCRFEVPFDMMDCDAGELQRKLEVLNSVMASETVPPGYGGGTGGAGGGRHLQLQQTSGVSEDSDYTSDIGYPIGQNPNSSASQYLGAANSLAGGQGYPHHQLSPGYPGQHQLSPGYGSGGYPAHPEMSPSSAWPEDELYYNSRPPGRTVSSQQGQHGQRPRHAASSASQPQRLTRNVSETGRRHSLERQTTLYEEQPAEGDVFADGWPAERQRETKGEEEAEYEYDPAYQEYYVDENGQPYYEYAEDDGQQAQHDSAEYYGDYDAAEYAYDPEAYPAAGDDGVEATGDGVTFSSAATGYSEVQAGNSGVQAGYSEAQTGHSEAQTGYGGVQPGYGEYDADDYDQAAEYYDEETGDYFDGTAWSYYDEDSGEWYYYDDGTYNENYNYAYDSSEQLNQTEKDAASVARTSSGAAAPPASVPRVPLSAGDGRLPTGQKKPDFGLGNLGLTKLTSSLGQIGQSVGQTVRGAGSASSRPGSTQSAQGGEQLTALGNKVGTKTKEVGSMFAGLFRGLGADTRLAKTPAQSTPNLAKVSA
ncbi:phorbol ester/diacylglycerol-binding protein unc-13-like [Pollicipes pollicipes]|uniref:phorbol ester/diacylglycerol-binding protein unc-13-like n=1 Tax=Pollicipes pollicipes TaxID=41117 RepID=UPI001884EA79|nr:phorbol ester/diacylglycerol-binding protein unc-13-like [Pollicipes pollicipes]